MSGLTLTKPAAAPRRLEIVSTQRRATIIDASVVALACLAFFGICIYQLRLPGLYPDEAFDVIPTMQILLGHPVELQRGVGIPLFGTELPLMSSSDYQGVTSTYLALPFFAIGGINVISLRLMTVLVGVLAIVLAYFLARSWLGAVPARLTVLMLATSAAWIFWSRIGVYVVSEVVPITEGALLALTIWVRRRPIGSRNGPLYFGMFLLGLGLATKLLFLWVLVAVPLCAAVLWGRQIWENRHSWLRDLGRWLRVAFLAAAGFCLGAFPFLLYNVLTRGATLQVMRANLNTSSRGVNNHAVLRNLWTVVDAFKVVLDGGYFWFQGVHGQVYSNPVTPSLFALSAFGLLALALAAKRGWRQPLSRTLLVGIGSLALALILATALASGAVGGAVSALPVLAVALLAIGGVVALVLAPLQHEGETGPAGWALFGVAVIAGAVWWFGGMGRPDGPAPGGFLGLWPVDAAGVVFWLSAGGLMLVLGFDRSPAAYQRATVAMLTLIALVVAQSAVTVSGLYPTHLIVLLPLPQMVIAAFVISAGARLADWARRASTGVRLVTMLRTLPAAVLVTGILLFDLGVDYSYHRDLGISGGGTTFSDAIYGLASYLKQQKGEKVVAMDWGFKRPIQFLTLEQVNPVEAYGYSQEPTPDFYTGLDQLLASPNTLYLFHTAEITAYQRYDAFVAEAQREGKRVELVQRFYHRDGWPIYEVYTAK